MEGALAPPVADPDVAEPFVVRELPLEAGPAGAVPVFGEELLLVLLALGNPYRAPKSTSFARMS